MFIDVNINTLYTVQWIVPLCPVAGPGGRTVNSLTIKEGSKTGIHGHLLLQRTPQMSLKHCRLRFVNEIGARYRPLVFLLAPRDQLGGDNNKCIHLEGFHPGDKWFYPWAIDYCLGISPRLSLLCILSEGPPVPLTAQPWDSAGLRTWQTH